MGRRHDPLFLFAAFSLLAVTVIGGVQSSAWIGKTFPGFLVLENRVIASAGLGDWPATQGGEIYQREVVAVDGTSLARVADLHAYVEQLPPGTPVSYRLNRDGTTTEYVVATRRFSGVDYALLFGSYLFAGLGLGIVALTIRYMRREDRSATSSAFCLWLMGMWALTATDLYGPYRLFRLHSFLECFLFAAALQLAFVFPYRRAWLARRPSLLAVPYGAAGALALVTQIGLQDPDTYVATHLFSMEALAVSMVVLIAMQVQAYFKPPDFRARQRVKVLVIGSLATFSPQLVLLATTAASGGAASLNLMGWSGVLFPVSIGYAVLRDDLLEVDSFVRRSIGYILLTAVVALAYAGAITGFESLIVDRWEWARGLFVLCFAGVSAMVLLPLRNRLQSTVDRLFFRSAWDFRRLVENTSERLTSATDLNVVAGQIRNAVVEALQPDGIHLLVRRRTSPAFESVLAEGGSLETAMEVAQTAEAEAGPFDVPGNGLGIPFRIDNWMVAVLVVGRRLSGRYYGGDDRRLLHTLAHQGAVAIDNALAVEQLRELNRNLEQKVQDRTAELRETQSQLVHQEKMASLGQLVAGVAHEINNPINFVQGNLHVLKDYAESLRCYLLGLTELIDPDDSDVQKKLEDLRNTHDVEYIFDDLEDAFSGCEEGVERTTTIIQDLRTFSRHDCGETATVNIHDGIESTLALLNSRLRGIEVVRDFDELPSVECLAGQVNQVWMNLLANAADAVDGHGRITIRTRTCPSSIRVEIEDDGCGIPEAQLARIFDPFYTTKGVGSGTGLGLAITYGIIRRHGGEIQVTSDEGQGTRFSVELPRAFTGEGSQTGEFLVIPSTAEQDT